MAISKTAYATSLVRIAQTENEFKLANIKADDYIKAFLMKAFHFHKGTEYTIMKSYFKLIFEKNIYKNEILPLIRQGNSITISIDYIVFLDFVRLNYKEILLKLASSEIDDLKAKYMMAFAHESDVITIDEKGDLSLFHNGEIRLSNRQKEISTLPLLGYYNLACYYAALAEFHSNNQDECDDFTREASIYLKYVFNQDKTQKEWAKKDPSLTWILKKDPSLIP